MTEIQIKILSLLEEVDRICRENDIEYYLEGGAVLGAIRHGGFLPWDDDSDLAMTRSNWNKFLEAFNREKPKDRALESPEINDMYPTNTVRYVDTTTTSILRSLMYDVCACGISVDIFILEDAPDNEDEMEQMKRDFIDYCEIINPFYRMSSLGSWERFRKHLDRSKSIGRSKVAEELNEKILRYHGQPSERYLMRWGPRFQIYNKAVFGKPTYVPFEHLMLPIPERPLDYLVYQYGIDWGMIPEAEDVELHDTALDLNTGYRDYMDIYMPLINKEEAIKINMKYKTLHMELMEYNKIYHKHIYENAGRVTSYMLKRKLKELNLDLATVFKDVTPENNELFENIFGDYVSKQSNQWYRLFGAIIPIEDDVLHVVISYLMRSGRCRDAEKILLFREEQKIPFSAELSAVMDAYHDLVKATNLFWSGLPDEASKIIYQKNNLYKAPVEKAIYMYNAVLKCGEEELLNKKAQVEELIARYEGEDLLKLVFIQISLRLKDREKAKEMAQQIEEKSRNGMVLRALQIDPVFQELRELN